MLLLIACGVTASLVAAGSVYTAQSQVLEVIEQPGGFCCDAIAIAPDGRLLATAAHGRVTLWDLDTGLRVRNLAAPVRVVVDRPEAAVSGSFTGLAFDPAGQHLASTALDVQLPHTFSATSNVTPPNVWEVGTGRDISDVAWRYNGSTQTITAAGFPFENDPPAFWQLSPSRTHRAPLAAYREPVHALSPDGTIGLVLSSDDAGPQQITAVDVRDGRRLWTSPAALRPRRIVFSPDNRWLLTSDYESVRVREVRTGTEVASGLAALKRVSGIAFSRDGASVAVTGDHYAHVYSVEAWKKIADLALDEGHAPQAVVFTPDGTRVISGNRERLFIWDRATGRELRRLEVRGPRGISGIAVSPGGRWLAAGTPTNLHQADGTVILWTLDGAMAPQWLWEDDAGDVRGVAFSHDARSLGAASVGEHSGNRASGLLHGNLSVCQLPACNERRTLLDPDKAADTATEYVRPEAAATDLAFTPDGRTLVAAVLGVSAHTDEEIQFHEYESYPRLLFFDARTLRFRRAAAIGGKEITAVAIGPGGRTVATAHDEFTARVWSLATARQQRHFAASPDEPDLRSLGLIHGVGFDRAGGRLVTAGENGIAVWDVATGSRIQALDAAGSYGAAAFTPDGSLLIGAACASSLDDHSRANIRAWDAATLQPRWTAPTSGTCVSRVAIDPRGRWMAASTPTGILIHALPSGARLMQLAIADGRHWLAWTPDGRYAGTDEGIARLAAVRAGTRAQPLPAHGRRVALADLFAQISR